MSSQTESKETFDQWAIVELFGHSRIAGRVTEQTIGGCSFVRVDVPEVDGLAAFTKLYGQGAIYAISFVDEEIARAATRNFRSVPVDPYTIGDLRDRIQKQLEHKHEQVGQAEDFNDDP